MTAVTGQKIFLNFYSSALAARLFFLVHNQFDLPFDLTDADFLIFGHTHRYTFL